MSTAQAVSTGDTDDGTHLGDVEQAAADPAVRSEYTALSVDAALSPREERDGEDSPPSCGKVARC